MIYPSDIFPLVFIVTLGSVVFVFRRKIWHHLSRHFVPMEQQIQDPEQQQRLLSVESSEISLSPMSLFSSKRLLNFRDINWSNTLRFNLNGKPMELVNPDPSELLATFIREKMVLKGTKLGCEEGGCGACSVVLEDTNGRIGAVNSCLRLLCANDGQSITTVEGIGSVKAGLSDEQKRLVFNNGTQCGYCTPGWVTSMHALVESSKATNTPLVRADIDKYLDGNICRCTGYRPILQAFHSLCDNNGSQINCTHQEVVDAKLCKTYNDMEDITGQCDGHVAMQKQQGGKLLGGCSGTSVSPNTLVKKNSKKVRPLLPVPLYFQNPATGKKYLRPVTLDQFCAVLREFQVEEANGNLQILGGNTSLGVVKYLNGSAPFNVPTDYRVVVDINQILELNTIKYEDTSNSLTIGAASTINECIEALKQYGRSSSSTASSAATTVETVDHSSIFAVTAHHLYRIANTQVRNAGTWAGNFMIFLQYRDFPSDAVLAFTTARVQLNLCDLNGVLFSMSIDEFLTYSYDDFKANGYFLISLTITESPANTPERTTVTETAKIAAREHNAHAYVDGGFAYGLNMTGSQPYCTSARVVFGGVTKQIFVASRTQKALENNYLNQSTFQLALQALRQDAMAIGINEANGDFAFLLSEMQAFFYHSILHCFPVQQLPHNVTSALIPWYKPFSRGVEVFPEGPETDSCAPIAKPIRKLEGPIQATGEAVYPSDEVLPINGVQAQIFYSTECAKVLVSIDSSAALAIDGVIAVYTAQDIEGTNTIGNGNMLFIPYGEMVPNVGAPLGVVVATTEAIATLAATLVKVTYDVSSATKPIVNLEDAIAHHSYFHHIPAKLIKIAQGDARSALQTAPYRARGRVSAAGQYHFYMETQSAMATIQDANVIQVICGTQDPANYQSQIASVLNTSSNQVVVKCPRVGGAFGGKITGGLYVSAAAALVASKLHRPARIFNTRVNDMNMQGGREEWLADYDVGFASDGTVLGLEYKFYLDGGSAMNDTIGALYMGMTWADNAYYFPNYHAEAKLCKTNTPSRTSMRAPGVVQACLITEMVMDRIATELNIPTNLVQERNFISNGNTAITGQSITHCTLQDVWQKVLSRSRFAERYNAIQGYNVNNLWRKRGIAISPVKYGVGWNGYNAGVRIGVRSSDGYVTVTHSGTEIGQGINTKVAQAVAMALQIDISYIRIDNTATNAVTNGGVTGGSGTSEVMVQAALNACATLNARIDPYRTPTVTAANIGKKVSGKAMDPTDWVILLQSLPCDVSLNVEGWYSPTENPNKETFQYFVYAACVTEVEYNVLTGEVHVLACELVYDCGRSLNPAIDIGQIEGGLVMGLGYFFQEKVSYDRTSGVLKSIGTWEYKPPLAQDIPSVLNVTLLANAYNTEGILGSKAVGEPPYIAINSAFFAVKQAIGSARRDAGSNEYFPLPVPCTVDIRHNASLLHANRFVLPY